jgi:glutathione synthase/RimK-type ligase-like ATP-grasp enzyme
MNKALLLRRKGWERNSADKILHYSKKLLSTLQTGEEWPEGTSLVFRWGCTANAPTKKVVNTARAIHFVADKGISRKTFADAGLAPRTWLDKEKLYPDWALPFKVIVRPRQHSRGKNFSVCTTQLQVEAACEKYEGSYYISEYIPKVAEYRVLMCQGRVLAVNEKIPMNKDLHAWGLARDWINIRWGQWPLRVVESARGAFLISGLDFGAVDVIVTADGTPYVLEINTAPELPGEYQPECVAKAFDYIVENGKDPIPVIEAKGGWKKFIHPALSEEAIIVEE